MSPDDFLSRIVDPGLEVLHGLGGPGLTDDARRMLVAIALQESGPGLAARYQSSPSASPGPARGWWQFERGGGVAGVLAHPRSKDLAAAVCAHFTVVPQDQAVWRALEGHDGLATSFARLLLWTDPAAMPTSEAVGWQCYLRQWRPGKPHPEVWPGNWRVASAAVGS
jgi:hypothetical protein